MFRIREERHTDINAIRLVNDQAFGQKNEDEVVDKLRDRGMLLLSLVAVRDLVFEGKRQHETVGHIAFSPVTIESEGANFMAAALAPMAVLPAYQRRGIGSRLVKTGLRRCLHLGHTVVVVLGHPEYYPRFGFVPARPLGIDCEFEVPDDAWMLVELEKGALAARLGIVKFQPEFRETV